MCVNILLFLLRSIIICKMLHLIFLQEILKKVSGPLRSPVQGMKKVGSSKSKANGPSVHPVLSNTQRSGVAAVQDHTKV